MIKDNGYDWYKKGKKTKHMPFIFPVTSGFESQISQLIKTLDY